MKNKIFYLSKRIIKSELICGSFYVFLGSAFSSFLGFLTNLFFARSLTTSDYGIYASLIALITLFTIPASSLSPIIIKFAGNYFAKNEDDKLKFFYRKMTKLLAFISGIIFLIFFASSPFLKEFLKLDNFLYLPLIGLVIAFSYLNVVNYGFLKGLLKFSCFAINQFSGALLRLLTGIMLIFLGFKVFGAIWPSLFSYVLIFLLGLFQLRFLFTKIKKTNIKIPSGDIIKYAIPTTLAILSLSSFISIDVILVKHFFNAHDAGLYSGLSLVGKVIYYLTGMIPLVMFPLVVKRQAKGESIVNLFYLAVFIVTIPSVLITCFYYLFPSFSISLFLGKEYLRAIPYLGLFGVYLTIFSILNICVNFFLSIGKTKIFIPVFVAAILQIVFIYAYHNSFYQVIGISITIISILLIYLLFIFIKEFINLRSVKNFLENSINSQQLN